MIALAATGSASAAQGATSVSVRDPVDGSHDRLDVRGTLRFATPAGWARTSTRNASTAKFELAEEAGCTMTVHVSTRGAASSATTRSRVTAATKGPGKVTPIEAGTRALGGYWRLIALAPDRKHADGAELYGVGSSVVARHVQLDVRAFGFASGCSTTRVRAGDAARGIATLLRTASVRVRVVARSG